MVGVAKAEEEGGAVQELAAPLAVALSPDGKTLAVADTGNHRWPRTPATFHPRIRIYSANSGRPILSFGARGEGEARGGSLCRARPAGAGGGGGVGRQGQPPRARHRQAAGGPGRPTLPGVHSHRGVDQDSPGKLGVQGG